MYDREVRALAQLRFNITQISRTVLVLLLLFVVVVVVVVMFVMQGWGKELRGIVGRGTEVYTVTRTRKSNFTILCSV